MKPKRHKWHSKPIGESSNYKGGLATGCTKCNCVKEIIGGKVTYFINDTVYYYAPPCKESITNTPIE